MSLWTWSIGIGAGLAAGYVLGRRRSLRAAARGAGGTILPSPSVRWLREAYGALGVWTLGVGEAAVPEAALDAGVAAAEAELVEGRLKRATVGVVGAVERLERGVLIVERLGDRLAAMLLPTGTGSAGVAGEKLDRVRKDLQALLEAMAYRGVADEFTTSAAATVDSPGTLALGLAFELEQLLGVETIVAVLDGGIVRILGISGRADRRLLNMVLPPDSPLAQVARGEVPVIRTPLDPTGRPVQDRRHRAGHAEVFVLRGDRDIPIGAVSMALPGDGRLAQPAQLMAGQILKLAGPRLWASIRLERERTVARTDALTGLPNRRGIEEIMGMVGLAGAGTGGALVACDLDRFKSLNDALGHAAGDAALVHFAAILKELVRGSDTAARVGGEEFHVWALGATLERGAEIGERIRARLAESQFAWQGTPWPMTASFGVAGVPATSTTVHNLPVQADAALYVAKQRGRNRVEVAPTS